MLVPSAKYFDVYPEPKCSSLVQKVIEQTNTILKYPLTIIISTCFAFLFFYTNVDFTSLFENPFSTHPWNYNFEMKTYRDVSLFWFSRSAFYDVGLIFCSLIFISAQPVSKELE